MLAMQTRNALNRLPQFAGFVPVSTSRWYSRRTENVGFIGLGNMGMPMARNILSKGKNLFVHDLNMDNCARLMKEDATGGKVVACNSVQELVAHSDVVVSMLPNGACVKDAYLKKGVISNIKRDAIVIDCSTIDPASSKIVSNAIENAGGMAFGAPVSGGVMGAKNGNLTFMVGANSKQDVKLAEPILELMGKQIYFCGGHGSGMAVKLCNNMLLGISMIGTAEAMNLGNSLGVDPHILAQVINSSSGQCWSSKVSNPCPNIVADSPSSRDYNGGFGIHLMQKDMKLALQAAKEVNAKTNLAALASDIYSTAAGIKEFNGKDFGIVYKLLQE